MTIKGYLNKFEVYELKLIDNGLIDNPVVKQEIIQFRQEKVAINGGKKHAWNE